MNSSKLRLIWSAIVAFSFYFGWAYWANMGTDIPSDVTFKSAIVQGSYSGLVTLFFTLFIETLVAKFGASRWSLAFVTPILCRVHSKTSQNRAIKKTFANGINQLARFFNNRDWRVVFLLPLLPITVQSILVIGVNWLNQTPNLWLTVTPSILFSSLYAYSYTLALLRLDE